MSRPSPTPDSVHTAVAGGAVAFGAWGVLAPRSLHRVYGTGPLSPDGVHMTRLWGCALGAIGVLALGGPPEERRRALATAAGMNVVNALLATGARNLPGRARARTALTSALFGTAAAWGARSAT